MTVKRMDNVLIVVDDLEAVKAHDIDAVVARMRPTEPSSLAMLRSLLEDRFKLKVHWETRELSKLESTKRPVEVLVIDSVQRPSEKHGSGEPMDILDKSVDELELTFGSYNCLKNANIRTLRDLVSKTEGELLQTKQCDSKSLAEISEVLPEMGLHPWSAR